MHIHCGQFHQNNENKAIFKLGTTTSPVPDPRLHVIVFHETQQTTTTGSSHEPNGI